MICPNCGREVSGKFCPFCGSKLNVETAAPAVDDGARQDRPAPENAPIQANVPNQNYAPNQNQYYPPNQNYSPNYTPNQNYQQNQYYAPNQGYMPPRQPNDYQAAPGGALGQTPAIQMLRKIATSPVFLAAILLTTVCTLFSCYVYVRNLDYYFDVLDYYKRYSAESQLVSNIVSNFISLLLSLAALIALWSIFASAASKHSDRMRTGGLTFFKVLYVIALVIFSLVLLLVLVLLVMLIASKKYSDFFQSAVNQLNNMLLNAGYEFPSISTDPRTFLFIFLGVILLVMIMAVLYCAKIVKSLNTAKRVIKTGAPDDRVSVFVGVFSILGAVGNVINAIRIFANLRDYTQLLGMGRGLLIVNGIVLLLSAVASILYAITLFRFRSGMRSLGVRKGILQNPMY